MPMTVEQKKAMRGLIHDLLLSPPVQKIDFDFAFSHGYGFNRHKVDGFGFAHVALLLTTPLGSGRGISVDSRTLGPDVAAEYSYAENLLIFPRPVFGSTQ
jgi:hypothetical protein